MLESSFFPWIFHEFTHSLVKDGSLSVRMLDWSKGHDAYWACYFYEDEDWMREVWCTDKNAAYDKLYILYYIYIYILYSRSSGYCSNGLLLMNQNLRWTPIWYNGTCVQRRSQSSEQNTHLWGRTKHQSVAIIQDLKDVAYTHTECIDSQLLPKYPNNYDHRLHSCIFTN